MKRQVVYINIQFSKSKSFHWKAFNWRIKIILKTNTLLAFCSWNESATFVSFLLHSTINVFAHGASWPLSAPKSNRSISNTALEGIALPDAMMMISYDVVAKDLDRR